MTKSCLSNSTISQVTVPKRNLTSMILKLADERSLNRALLKFAEEEDLSAMELAIHAGANINAVNDFGQTALIRTARNGNDKAVEMLIAAGANINVTDQQGWSALFLALLYSYNNKIAKALIAAGADLNIADKDGRTLLMHVDDRNNYKATEMLIEASAERARHKPKIKLALDDLRQTSGQAAAQNLEMMTL